MRGSVHVAACCGIAHISGTEDYHRSLEDDPFATKFRSFDPVEAGFPVGVPPHNNAKPKWKLSRTSVAVTHVSLSTAPQGSGTKDLYNDPPHVVRPFEWK